MKSCSPNTCFWITINVISLLSLSVVGQQCKLHDSKYLQRCCIPITIARGYQPVMCNADDEVATAELCPVNTYQPKELSSAEFHLCERHSTCPSPNMITAWRGNDVSDTRCQCNEHEGYHDSRSDVTYPLQSYHCLRGDPAETSTRMPISEQLGRISFGLGIASCVVAIASGVVYRYRQNINNLCKQGGNESTELSSIAVEDQTKMQHDDGSHSVEADAHRPLNSIKDSNLQDESDYGGSAMSVNYNLHPDYDNSKLASLCCEVDDRHT